MAAFNPNGAEPASEAPDRDEGYLYWAAWLAHNGVSVFNSQDAHGLYAAHLLHGRAARTS